MPSLLDSTPTLDTAKIESLSRTLLACRVACGNCADAWLARSPLNTDALRCIRMILDCADLCATADELLPYFDEASPVVLRSHLGTCAVSCERTARELLRSGHAGASTCIAACREAAASCRSTIPLLPAVAAAAA